MIFFIWAIRTGQFDDMHTPSVRMLWDDQIKKTGAANDQRPES
jgi:cbb3-type cytochrome oxidase maturation protein